MQSPIKRLANHGRESVGLINSRRGSISENGSIDQPRLSSDRERRREIAEVPSKAMRRSVILSLTIFSSLPLVTHSGIFLFVRSVELNDSVFNGVTYAIVNACLSMQLITFASLSFLLYKRFRYLCERLLMPEGGSVAEELRETFSISPTLERSFAICDFHFLEFCR